MSSFGIEGYEPHWLSGISAIESAHGGRLGRLAGRTLTRAWLVWDLDDDTWWADCPVLLDFGGEQVEVNHQKLDECAITWNTIDPARPVRWAGADDLRLAWRAETSPDLTGLCGQSVHAVDLLEWAGDRGDLANGTVALGFTFTGGHLTVDNALDENGLRFTSPAAEYRRRRQSGGAQPQP